MKPKWIVDERLLKGTLCENFADAIEALGYECFRMQSTYPGEVKIIPFKVGECVIVYGTHETVYHLGQRFSPGAYYDPCVVKCSSWFSSFKGKLLNEDYKFMTFSAVSRQPFPFFLRPDKGDKSFSGTIVRNKSDLDKIDQSRIDGNVITASLKDIHGEYRFIIVNNEVISGSQYRCNGVLDIRRDYPKEAFRMAEHVASSNLELKCYACDVAITDDGAKIIELNSFSTSGLYACDQEKIIRAVSDQAERDYKSI